MGTIETGARVTIVGLTTADGLHMNGKMAIVQGLDSESAGTWRLSLLLGGIWRPVVVPAGNLLLVERNSTPRNYGVPSEVRKDLNQQKDPDAIEKADKLLLRLALGEPPASSSQKQLLPGAPPSGPAPRQPPPQPPPPASPPPSRPPPPHPPPLEQQLHPRAAEALRKAADEGLTLVRRPDGHSYRGVTNDRLHNRGRPYRATVKKKYLGHYETPEEAALAYARTPEAQSETQQRQRQQAVPMPPLTAKEALQQAEDDGLTLELAEDPRNSTGYAGIVRARSGAHEVFRARSMRGNFSSPEEAALRLAQTPAKRAAAQQQRQEQQQFLAEAVAAVAAGAARGLPEQQQRLLRRAAEALKQAEQEGLLLRQSSDAHRRDDRKHATRYRNVGRELGGRYQRTSPPAFRATISRQYAKVRLGTFETAEEAALCVARSPEQRAAARRRELQERASAIAAALEQRQRKWEATRQARELELQREAAERKARREAAEREERREAAEREARRAQAEMRTPAPMRVPAPMRAPAPKSAQEEANDRRDAQHAQRDRMLRAGLQGHEMGRNIRYFDRLRAAMLEPDGAAQLLDLVSVGRALRARLDDERQAAEYGPGVQ